MHAHVSTAALLTRLPARQLQVLHRRLDVAQSHGKNLPSPKLSPAFSTGVDPHFNRNQVIATLVLLCSWCLHCGSATGRHDRPARLVELGVAKLGNI